MKIRRTNKISEVKELHKIIFPSDDLDILEEDILWIVKNDKNENVGFCSLRILDNEIVYFNWAGLIEEAWGYGLHKRMIKTRLRWAKKHNYKYAITYALIDNIQSSKNLLKAKFELYIPDYEWGDEKCLYFRRKL